MREDDEDDPEDIFLANDPKRGIATQDMVKRGDEFQLLNFDVSKWSFDLEELRNPNHEAPALRGTGEGFQRVLVSELDCYSKAIPRAVKAQFPASTVGSMSPEKVLEGMKIEKRFKPKSNWKKISGDFLLLAG